ncbi:MAG: D-aminoacylase, partial [Bacteroidota bacterium]
MIEVLDYLIVNATIVDGSGKEPFIGSVGIADGKIVAVDQGNNSNKSKKTIDGRGLFLTPGFIDTHASTGYGFFFPHAADHKLYQGITTEIFGNCGTSPAPVGPFLEPKMEEIAKDLEIEYNWHSLGEYYKKLEEIGLQFNIASLAGHNTIRWGHVEDWAEAKADEQVDMLDSLEQSMKDGALGLSTGLVYVPGSFANTDEIIELAKVVKKYGGIYASHMRDERDKLEEAIEETLTIGEQAGINVLVSHLKSAEKRNFGKIPKVLRRLEEYNSSHSTKAKIDVYPYTAVST